MANGRLADDFYSVFSISNSEVLSLGIHNLLKPSFHIYSSWVPSIQHRGLVLSRKATSAVKPLGHISSIIIAPRHVSEIPQVNSKGIKDINETPATMNTQKKKINKYNPVELNSFYTTKESRINKKQISNWEEIIANPSSD